ncbi:MAG: hypothetical protein ACR2PJ_02865, partial [Pseudomonadales bacterium]
MPAQKPKPSAPSAKALRPVDDVAAEVLASVKPITGTQIQPIAVAYGRYLAEDLLAPVAVPPADNSAMD